MLNSRGGWNAPLTESLFYKQNQMQDEKTWADKAQSRWNCHARTSTLSPLRRSRERELQTNPNPSIYYSKESQAPVDVNALTYLQTAIKQHLQSASVVNKAYGYLWSGKYPDDFVFESISFFGSGLRQLDLTTWSWWRDIHRSKPCNVKNMTAG